MQISAQRVLKVLTVIGAAGAGAYFGTRFLFSIVCTLSGHNFTEEIYSGWSVLVFTIAWSTMGAFHAIEHS